MKPHVRGPQTSGHWSGIAFGGRSVSFFGGLNLGKVRRIPGFVDANPVFFVLRRGMVINQIREGLDDHCSQLQRVALEPSSFHPQRNAYLVDPGARELWLGGIELFWSPPAHVF